MKPRRKLLFSIALHPKTSIQERRMLNSDGSEYQNVEEFKLLGDEFVSDPRTGVRWDTFIQKCIRQSYANMWILKRLSELGVSIEDKLLTYQSRIRIHLEQHTPLWHFSISKKLSKAIEKVQRTCVILILGQLATADYLCNLALLDLEPLSDRRDTLCKRFARKTVKHPVHSTMFTFVSDKTTRSTAKSSRKVVVPAARTARYDRSAVPNLARIINSL